MSLIMWQGAEQEYATNSHPMELFVALGDTGLFVFKQDDGIPRAFLRNGGLCYIHSNLFEICTPECRGPIEVVAYDKASEAYSRLASWKLDELGKKVHVYKTNIASDPKSKGYTTVGSHENYLVNRSVYLDNLHLLVPFLIMRQIFIGAGGYLYGSYLISPRTIFPKKIFSETSTDYPIISTRDESHASSQYTRAHIVNGEGVRSEYTNFLKHSIMSYVLRSIEEGHLKQVPEIEKPLESNREIAENIEGDWVISIEGGEKLKVTDYLNTYYLNPIEELFRNNSITDDDKKALNEFKWVLEKLDSGLIERLDDSIEWIIKKRLIENLTDYQMEEGLTEGFAKMALVNQYSAVTDPLYDRLVEENKVKTVLSPKHVERAFYEPPNRSRGELRVALAREFKNVIKTINWSYIKLKPNIRYEPFEFNELDDWTPDKIKIKEDEIRSVIE